jgi:hypothetical protein
MGAVTVVFGQGESVELQVETGTGSPEVAEVVKEAARRLGLTLNPGWTCTVKAVRMSNPYHKVQFLLAGDIIEVETPNPPKTIG